MQIFRLTYTFNCGDLLALMHRREAETGIHAPSIDVNGARTALAVIASLFRSGQMKMLAQAIEKRRARIDPHFIVLTIHPKRDWNNIRFRPFTGLVLIEHPISLH